MSNSPLPRPALTRHDSVIGEKRGRSPSEEPETAREVAVPETTVPNTTHEPDEEKHGYLPIKPLADALKQIVDKGIPSAVVERAEDNKETPHLYQPTAKGTWSFNNPEISQAAVDCFANHIGFNTERVEHPTAAQIFHIRASTQYYLNTGRLQPLMLAEWGYKDPTLEIELSYVGDEEDENAAPAAVWISNKAELPPPSFDFGVDQLSQHPHAPTNLGANDQRGLHGEAKYFTKDSHGTVVTVDRSIAVIGKPFQRHKAWIHIGRWEEYGSNIDWNDRKSIERLNKWRNQTMERDGWPLLRTKERKVYSDEQRTWLFKHICIANGGAPGGGYAELTRSFNKHFGLVGDAARARAGISEVCKRLMKEYEQFGGKQKPADPKRAAKKAKVAVKGAVNVIEPSKEEDSGEESDDPVMDKLVEEFGGEDSGQSEANTEELDRILGAFDSD